MARSAVASMINLDWAAARSNSMSPASTSIDSGTAVRE
jgi:hypothetical protein